MAIWLQWVQDTMTATQSQWLQGNIMQLLSLSDAILAVCYRCNLKTVQLVNQGPQHGKRQEFQTNGWELWAGEHCGQFLWRMRQCHRQILWSAGGCMGKTTKGPGLTCNLLPSLLIIFVRSWQGRWPMAIMWLQNAAAIIIVSQLPRPRIIIWLWRHCEGHNFADSCKSPLFNTLTLNYHWMNACNCFSVAAPILRIPSHLRLDWHSYCWSSKNF